MRESQLRGLMALATGYLIAFIFLDLFSEISGGFQWVFVGVLVVFLFDRFVTPHLSFLADDKDHEHCSHHHHSLVNKAAACSTIGCLILCTLFDGVAISSSYRASPVLGHKLLIGQMFHLIPEAILALSVSLAAGLKRKRMWIPVTAVGGSFVVGWLMPELFSGYQAYFLPMSAGILIYISFSQLLPISAAGKKGAIKALVGAAAFILTKVLGL